MPTWKNTIRIGDLHEDYQAGNLSIQKVGVELARRLKVKRIEDAWGELEEIIERFESVDDVEDYDNVLRDLYDFGDSGHLLWVDSSR